MLLRSLLVAPFLLGLAVVGSSTVVHAESYSVDPRFAGNPDIDVIQSKGITYNFNHGGNTYMSGGKVRGGYWSGDTSVTVQYKYISLNKMVVLANKSTANTIVNSSTNHGGGFYDTNFLGKFGYQGWTQNGVSQAEKRTAAKYINAGPSVPNNKVDGFDYSNNLLSYISNWSTNGVWYGSMHYNQKSIFTKNEYYYERLSGVQSQYAVYGDANHSFAPFSWINRYFMDSHTQARWDAGPLGQLTITNPDIKWINNTTGADNYTSYTKGYVIAPSGSYNINDNHDSDKKMLSWPTGGSNGKYYTTGDKLILRNMSPIIQAGGNYGTTKNGALWNFLSNQTFKQATWIPSGFDYKSGDVKMYAIKSDGSKVDVTSRFTFSWDGSVSNWSDSGSTKTDMQRLVATIKNLNDTSDGGYNNASTVGYSMIVPVTVNSTAHTDAPYAIRGGSQIINGVWHDTGTDRINIWTPSKPATTGTSSNATVFTNDSAADFTENKTFYETGTYANNKTFRSQENDGYFVWHNVAKADAVPDNVLNNKASDSSIGIWQTSQPLVFTIPYDNRYVKPIGGMVVRSTSSWTTMTVGTNGITGQDTGSSYIVTIPSTLINASLNQSTNWGVALKYKVNGGLPGGGVKISSLASTTDEISGLQNAGTIYNYLESPTSSFSFDTLSAYGSRDIISQYASDLNNSVHLVNGQTYGYNTNWNGIAKLSGSSGVGEPVKTIKLTADVKPNQIAGNIRVWKGHTQIWNGYVRSGQTSLIGSTPSSNPINGMSSDDILSSISGTISNARTLNATQHVEVTIAGKVLSDKDFLYDTDDLHIEIMTDNDSTSNLSNLTSNYGDNGKALTANLTASNGLTDDSSSTLSQFNSRVKPQAMLVKHGQWPANSTDSASDINLSESSIQAREVFDYRITQFLGNSNLPTEAYPTPFKFDVKATDQLSLTDTNLKDVVIKAYDLGGNVKDVTNQFDLSYANKTVTAVMKDQYVKAVTGKVGSAYNTAYVLSIPMKNQSDLSSTIKASINGTSTINGQTATAPYVDEFIPPETPYMYGYSATSSADAFNPKDPEKDKGKIAYGTSDGASTSAQISTAPVQWIIREQLGDMSGNSNGQKYNYAKFTATFPNADLFQNGKSVSWKVYNEAGTDVSSQFTGATTAGTGYKIQASAAFLKNMSNYGHKYYFVINQSTENNHANRLGMAYKAGLSNIYTAFTSLKSSMTAFWGSVGIGNTDHSVATQNFDMQTNTNLLQINNFKSGLNEKTSELNVNPFSNGQYHILTVGVDRPIDGYTVTGATAQYATNARAYESYQTTFNATGADDAQQVRANSVKIVDSLTNADVTSQYTVTTKDQQVVLIAKPEALQRMQNEHKVIANANVQDTVTFHVDTWGSRIAKTIGTWTVTHNINGYNDASSIERVLIPKAHAGRKEVYLSHNGNAWSQSDLELESVNDPVYMKIEVTIPTDLHNKDYTDFIAHYVATEITPYMDLSDANAVIALGTMQNNWDNQGTPMQMVSQNVTNNSLNNSRIVWKIPDSIANELNTTDAFNVQYNWTTYTVIISNIRFTPTAARPVSQYASYIASDNRIKIPLGGVTTGSKGSQSEMDGNYFEGRNGAIVDPTIGSLGSGTTLGAHSGKINVILPSAPAVQEGYVNGGESNTSFTNNGN